MVIRCPNRLFDLSEDAITSKIRIWTGRESIEPSKIAMHQAEAPDQVLQDQAIFLCGWGLIEWLVFVQTAKLVLGAAASII